MHRFLGRVLVLVCLALAGAAPAQQPLAASVVSARMPPGWLRAFDVHTATVQTLAVPQAPGAALVVDVVLAGAVVALELQPHDLRAPSFALLTRTATGLVGVPAGPTTTWRGGIAGEAESAVAATLWNGGLTAYVRRGDGSVWIVQPLRDAVPGAPVALHAVYRGSDGTPTNGRCGVVGAPLPLAPTGGSGGDAVWVCDLALEADFPLFQFHGGNVLATQNDVLGIVNAVDLLFDNAVQVHFVVTQLIVDAAPDPYTTNNASALLNQFQNHWNTAHAGVPRDVAHLFTGRPVGAASGGTIGIAFLGVVCNAGAGYGLSQTRWTNNYAQRVGVTAHELGHNFNAGHCDGQPGCGVMCSGIGGCAGTPNVFSAAEVAQIVAFRQTATCLVAQATPPSIASVAPASVATVQPALVTVYGDGLLGTTAVTVGSQQVTTGIQVVSDTVLRFTPPAGLALGPQPVTVTNPAGTSNPTPLTYAASNPCLLVVPNAVYGGSTFTWRIGGWPNDYAYLGLSWVDTTSPLLGFPVLDGLFLLWHGPFDANGLASFAVNVPPGLLSGFTVYSQALDQNLTSGGLRSVSGTPGTWIVF